MTGIRLGSIFDLKDYIIRSVLSLPGWKTRKKIVVFESDDWGSIRMPSRDTYDKILKKGFRIDSSPYNRYDALASMTDLQFLFETLTTIKDKNGKFPVLTANTITTNPDFERIRSSDFEEYYYEIFTSTLSRYPQHQQSFQMWQEGIKKDVFFPQFHGREHINVKRWMSSLKQQRGYCRLAFDFNMFDLTEEVLKGENSFTDQLNLESEDEIVFQANSIEEGTSIFKDLFGYRSKSFIAPSHIWSNRLNSVLLNCGVVGFQGNWFQLQPIPGSGSKFRKRFHYTGEKNRLGQIYTVRNAYFEPSLNTKFDWKGDILKRMSIAFSNSKPVVIGTHRLNYIGYIEEGNRDKNLRLLASLLKEIILQWPDIEFMTSEDLLFEIEGS